MFYVAYRDPQSLLTEDWKLQGSGNCHPYATLERAEEAAKELARSFNYDVRVMQALEFHREQPGSRQRY